MDRKYVIDTEENRAFLQDRAEDLLKFGVHYPAPGGSSYYLGDDGTPWKERDRATWITSRMVHVYCLGKFLGFPGSEELAAAGIRGLRGELHDQENGGWYAALTADGGHREGKECYAHAFVILAGTSGVLAGIPGAKELLDDALKTYDEHFWNEEEGLSCDNWNTEFTVCDSYRGLNANMHTVEAFLAAADCTGDEKYRVRAGRIIDRVLVWAKDNGWRIPEHYTTEWVPELEKYSENPADPFKPYGATPGHGIEWARLITQWAVSARNEEERKPYIEAAENLYGRAVGDAWNCDGAPGIAYTTDWSGKPVVHDRMHWTLAEAINTSSVLYRVTGKEKYAEDYSGFIAYADQYVMDHELGSWFHQLDSENHVIGTVWPGKSDLYHALQSMLIPYCGAVDLSIAPAMKEKCSR